MEENLRQFALFIAMLAEGAAAIIVAIAVAEAFVRSLLLFLPARLRDSILHNLSEKEEVRLRLGRWLAVALEFLLAADILKTAVAPSWDDIGKLAAIATLRTLLNYFLEKEIDKEEENKRLRAAAAAERGATL
jgi:uncharacterized membrane protein